MAEAWFVAARPLRRTTAGLESQENRHQRRPPSRRSPIDLDWGPMAAQTLACRIGAGLSSLESARDAAAEAVRQVQSGPPGRAEVDLAFVFISPAHMDEAEVAAEVVRAELAPRHLLGCVAEESSRGSSSSRRVPPWPSGRAAPGGRGRMFPRGPCRSTTGSQSRAFPSSTTPRWLRCSSIHSRSRRARSWRN